MTDTNVEELDLDSMSTDELESLMDDIDGGQLDSNKAETEVDQTEENQDNETSNVEVEEVAEDSQESESIEETTVKPQDEDDESDIEPQYRGKTKREVLDMQRHANSKISKQQNEIHHLKQQMEEFKRSQELAERQKIENKEEEDLLANYDENDISAIEKIVQRKLEQRDASRRKQTKAQIEEAISDNEKVWENLEVFNPDLYSKIQEKTMDAIRSDKDNTLHQKGWLKQYIIEQTKSESPENSEKKQVKKKRVATVSGGGVGNNSRKSTKSVDSMSAEEYWQAFGSNVKL